MDRDTYRLRRGGWVDRKRRLPPNVVANLAGGEGFSWLGYQIRLVSGELAVELRHDEAERLAFGLQHRRRRDESDRATRRRLYAWARSRGPAFGHVTAEAFLDVVNRALVAADVPVAIAPQRLLRYWELGHEHWQDVLASSLDTHNALA